MINLLISDQFIKSIDKGILEEAALRTLVTVANDKDAELSIVVENDEYVRKLNHDYRGINETTDVLSFPLNEIDPENGKLYLGDVVISYPKAVIQAQKASHPITAELQLLVIHGVLHLLGFDHSSDLEKKQMWVVQTNVLENLGSHIKNISDE
jgi:probable rRNA maturation factor